MKKYNWGILAPGKMSAKFARGLKLLDKAVLYSVGSRDSGRAEKFASEYGFLQAYGSYEELAADDKTDIVYIASPHSLHHQHTLMCLRNGKNVICEKAFALNTRQVQEMIAEARKQNLFLMEALWPHFQPFYRKAHEILKSGMLGEILHLHGWFSFQPPFDPTDRKFNLQLGGGSLLDIGIYPVIDALTFIGVPYEIHTFALFSPSGSEESITVSFRYNSGKMADLYSSFKTNEGIGCKLLCEKGNMIVSRGRDMNQRVILEVHGRPVEEFVFSPEAMGYHWEAEEVMRCLDNNLTESPVVPLSFSLDLIRTLDRIREKAGIVFPGE
ncbi:MAG: Gfo/Idh/MocA family oxidoreductase [Bacteroidales bacterium]|nr:Gfo/Idh/MocA family oxidoreductase [Bacteroidales bacterium]